MYWLILNANLLGVLMKHTFEYVCEGTSRLTEGEDLP